MPRSMLIPLTVLLLASLPAAAATTAGSRLEALFAAERERDLREDPLRATFEGDTRYNDRWPDMSPAALARRDAADRRVLAELDAVPRAGLSADEQLNYELFRRSYELRVQSQAFKPWVYDLSAREGLQVLNEQVELLPFVTTVDYEQWLRRLEGIGVYLDQYVALLRMAIAEKRTQPRSLMQRVQPQLEQQLVEDPTQSPFYAPFRQVPATVATADRQRLSLAAQRAIRTVVVPAYRRFLEFFVSEYLPACRTSDGIWDTPDGRAYYANRILFHTTTTLTADEIHALGLAEVARIRGEMDKVIREVGFKGSFAEFLTWLRTDPRFYYQTPDELFRAYVVIAKQIEPELPKLFGHLYRTPFGLRAIPATSAPTTTTAYYTQPSLDGRRAGYYYVNLYRPEVRPKYEMEVLTAHESVPGHHLQIAIAQEQTHVPAFRQLSENTAFVEGWALYAERLGYELGLYQDPYSRFGQLTYDMWRAVRLVVDTGIHARGWTRQQAIDYFTANAAKTSTDIENEVDRYIGWPGQALAYKIGQLRLLELRAAAERELGAKFDVREFHDLVLAQGALPLDVLSQRVSAWIVSKKS